MKYKILFILFLITTPTLAYAQGASTNLETDVIRAEPMPLQAGEYADIWVRITNTGSADAPNPTFEVVDSFPFQGVENTEWSPRGGIAAGETVNWRTQVKVNSNAVFGQNGLKIRKTSGSSETSITETLDLSVRTDDRSLIINNLEFPQRVEPGSTGYMTLTLQNLANSQFRNIDVSLDVSEIPIAPRQTSRKRITSIEGGNSRDVRFRLDVDGDAENQLYKLPIQINYQNQAGQELSVTETTGVNVGGFPNIDVGVDESDIRTSGTRGTVTFRILNKGEGQARFVGVQLEESDQYEIISEDSIYLGSMIADDYQTAEFDIYVNEDTENLQMPVKVEYRDGDGDRISNFNVTRELYTSSELSKYGISQSSSLLVPGIIVVVLVLGGIYYWRRKKE
jgi:hypothetical protein